MDYCRINLDKTNYELLPNTQFKILTNWSYGELNSIYMAYCKYKKFASVMPMFYEDFKNNEVVGYYHNNKLVAWSLIVLYPSQQSVMAEQFAWDYVNPELRLGIRSLEHECAYYKQQGYHYMYLHGADEYKKDFDGFETLGSV